MEQLQQLEDESSNVSREWNLEQERHVMARLLEQVCPRFKARTWGAFRRQMFDGQRVDAVASELGNSTVCAEKRRDTSKRPRIRCDKHSLGEWRCL